MNAVVIYKSSTGFTEQYAGMIATALKCPALKLGDTGDLNQYDLVIFGGWVRAAKIVGLKTALKKVNRQSGQKMVVFAVGANEQTAENTNHLKTENLNAGNEQIPFFYLQGGFAPEKLNFFLHMMLKNVAKSIEKKDAANPGSLSKEDQEFLTFFRSSHNDVSEENLTEMLKFIRESTGESMF
ncbi:MAG: hypothetical protein PWP51_2340 [Clostridiales bacterium]|jgi:menaquinone-dependent protoporphyrinogen IX oxidase|nr:hypothetical protein [Clostridiales bacterium]MDN5299787.1 hypothetical protein [Clostridiales bacterium]